MALARATEADDGGVEAFNRDFGARRKSQNAKYEFKMVCGRDTSEERGKRSPDIVPES